ncbi:MAG: hypothetical protein WKF92_13405 [Pyrinomonadaceae bacterium]
MAVDFQTLLASPTLAYSEGLKFFRGEGMINDALKRITADLDRNQIDYAVIGAVALNQHGYRRFTEDIDLLLSKQGLLDFRENLVGLGYRPAFEGAKKKFRTTDENIPVEIITSGEFPGDGLPKPVEFPNPSEFAVVIDGVKTVSLEKLIELKLSSGMTAGDRLKDLADVQELIKLKGLGEDYSEKLNEFVRVKFIELYRAVEKGKDRDTE